MKKLAFSVILLCFCKKEGYYVRGVKNTNWFLLWMSSLFLGILIGVGSTSLFYRFTASSGSLMGSTTRHAGAHRLTNPLLECELFAENKEELKSFRSVLEKYIASLNPEEVSHVSVYFRDLNNGIWLGINDDEKFAPASLLKVPFLITYLKKAEKDSSLLRKEVVFDGERQTWQQLIKPDNPLKAHTSYTVDYLLSHMIKESDNDATKVLSQNMTEAEFDQTYKDLGIPIDGYRTAQDFMSVKTYSAFFRILYNASYLSEEMSEKALQLLTQVNFTQGIRAGVPQNVQVAHKFGEREVDNDTENQLHDCGIIYYPNHPYLLCVMTRGKSFPTLIETLKRISRVTYQEVDKQYTSKKSTP